MLMLIRCPLFPTFLLFFYCYSNQIPDFFDCILPVVYRGGTGIKSRYLFVVVVSSSLPPIKDIRVGSGLVSTVFIHDGFQFVLLKIHIDYSDGTHAHSGNVMWHTDQGLVWEIIFGSHAGLIIFSVKERHCKKVRIHVFLKFIRFSCILLDVSHFRLNQSKFHQ